MSSVATTDLATAAPIGAPQAILDLVARFEQQLDAYKSGQYNETQVRREFLDPFFKALGWDIDNVEGYAEAYKDVIHEDSIKIGEAAKAPDYCFRIGGTRKFFLEAKKPSVDIKHDVHPAFQLRRYAWTTKLPLSVLSDFEEFAVYDCRVKPDQNDNAATARVLYVTFREYPQRWGEIAAIFSREAVLKGSFDKFAESSKLKRGTADVDEEFLQTIETWRKELAQNLALRNKHLTQRELNFAVQRIIDRIIFLRICEGRGIEDYGHLRGLVNGDRIYPRLAQLFEAADNRYNSGLFHFKREKDRHEAPDELTLSLEVDDKLLRDIIKGLYYPESPYVFSALPADILGHVYEQFLGKVIRLTEGHQAKVDEKPEVKKAGGVYYTPTYIVDYIVQQTVGKLAEGKTPKQVSQIRILDPACGSGSFLIGAYQFLLDWHRDFYVANDPQKWARGGKPALVQTGAGWKLTIAERKRILLNNIYGVDIDTQAVEVTKLSLLLKVLEGETGQTLQTVFRLFHERALPDLGDNIKCGNSLIGPDFYAQQQMTLLDDEERYRINVFDWQNEFPEIFKAGGFDAVIGNPPYVLLQDEFRDDKQLKYFRSKFLSASYKIDTYHLFIERAIALSRQGGRCSMITPANFLTNNHLDKLRRLILNRTAIQLIVVIDGGVFQGISVDNAVFVLIPGKTQAKDFEITHARNDSGRLSQLSRITISRDAALEDEHVLFTGTSEGASAKLWQKIARQSWALGEIADVNFGKQLRDRKEFVRDVISVADVPAIPPSHRPCYTGRDVNRYALAWGGLACLKDEVARRGGCWDIARHDAKDKLVTRQIGRYPDFALDGAGWHCLNTMFMVNLREPQPKPAYVLAILNSKLTHALWLDRFYDQRRTFPKIKGTYLKQLPIARIDFSKASEKATHDRIAKLAEQMLALHRQLASAKTPQEKTALERQIAATDTQIDRLVYELYGLTEDEVKIVEGSGTPAEAG